MLDALDFNTTDCFIAKYNGYFAHGDTLREAVADAINKALSNMDIDEKIQEFVNKFKDKQEYPAEEFYSWHGILTGSCNGGRKHFVVEKGIDMSKKYTPNYFVNVCKNAYGGDVIQKLGQFYAEK